jgi:hypothetical protein
MMKPLTSASRNTGGRMMLLGLALAVVAIVCRRPLESTMARHMLLQIPLLVAAGSCIAFGLRGTRIAGIAGRLRACDENGITGLFAFLLASAYWMIPKTLDSAAISLATDAGKFISLLLAGLLLPASLARANVIIQLFFIGNFASMTAIAGMLYQDTPRRLCNLYLIDDQMIAGAGLVTLAIGVAVAWGIRQLTRPAQPTPALPVAPSVRQRA